MPKRYRNTEILKTEEGRQYYRTVIYPEIPLNENDLYTIAVGGDRYETLALDFYNDSTLWWIIASANSTKRFSLVIQPGTQLRIPANPQGAQKLYEDLNKNR